MRNIFAQGIANCENPLTEDTELDEILGEIFERIEAGDPPAPEEYIERFPHLKDDLTEFFRNQAWFGAGQLDETTAGGPAPIVAPSLVGYKVGPYELVEEIARGGMGVVYRGKHEELNRDVAVKLISSGALASPEELKRFRMEAEAAGQLQHPNIVPIHDVGSWRGQTYFSMALVEGASLEDWVESRHCALEDSLAVVRDIARAAHYAHERGIVHRDLKPANILIDAEGRPMLTDFGLAKLNRRGSALTQTGQVLGTPNYMSPEQALGSPEVGPAADVYALGAVLYALITGQPPHSGDSAPQVLSRVLQCDPVPPRELNREVCPDTQRVCLHCLEREPADRYATAEDLANDLDRVIRGEEVAAGGSGMMHSLARTLRRDQHHEHFRNWGRALVLMGVLIFLTHIVMYAAVTSNYDDLFTYWVPRGAMFLGLLAIVYHYRNGAMRARSTAERPVWSIWLGYLLALATANLIFMLQGASQVQVFPIAGALAGFGFVAMGGHVWGGCYMLGGLFLVCSLLSASAGASSILAFGGCWFVALLVLGYRYRGETLSGVVK